MPIILNKETYRKLHKVNYLTINKNTLLRYPAIYT